MAGPFIKIVTSEQLRFSDGTQVSSPAAFLGWHRERLAEAGDVAVTWRCDLLVPAYINWGRWLADCPNCQCACQTHPLWRLGCCSDCACVFGGVVVPDDHADIERVLLLRPLRKTQNWRGPETVDDLRAENEAHGVAA